MRLQLFGFVLFNSIASYISLYELPDDALSSSYRRTDTLIGENIKLG
jgi:hypothetical protein